MNGWMIAGLLRYGSMENIIRFNLIRNEVGLWEGAPLLEFNNEAQ